VGGTWRDNVYPGCRCDVQSNLYSFSFAPNPNWSNTFPAQPELRAYLKVVASRFGVRPYVRFGCDVTSVRWDDAERLWHITASGEVIRAQYVIAGVGSLVEPSLPDIPGIERYTGQIMHSARWDRSWSAAGRRVAVIGTGASAIQIVPAIQPQAEHLTVFQRTAPYVVPHTGRPVGPWRHAAYRYLPGAQTASRVATYWMREVMVFGFVKRPAILKKAEAVWKTHMERAVADPVKRETHAALRPRLQAGHAVQRLLPGDRGRQRRPRHREDHRVSAGWHRHR
jgi:cation diffusion facilitator CzcD-associated flavoprotein CzcO